MTDGNKRQISHTAEANDRPEKVINQTPDGDVNSNQAEDPDLPRMEEYPIYIEDTVCYKVFDFCRECLIEFYKACGRHKRYAFSICLIILSIVPFLWINITIFPEYEYEYWNSGDTWYPAYLIESAFLLFACIGTCLHSCCVDGWEYDVEWLDRHENAKILCYLPDLFTKCLKWMGRGENVSIDDDFYFFVVSHIMIRLAFLYATIPIMHYTDTLASYWWIPTIIATFPINIIYGIYYSVVAIYVAIYYAIHECCVKPVRACKNGKESNRNNRNLNV